MKGSGLAKRVDQVKALELPVNAVRNNPNDVHEPTAHEFATHPDFAKVRADGVLWDAASFDGLTEVAA